MLLGIGSGSTLHRFVTSLGRRVREEGLRITGVPSLRGGARHSHLPPGIPIVDLDSVGELDLRCWTARTRSTAPGEMIEGSECLFFAREDRPQPPRGAHTTVIDDGETVQPRARPPGLARRSAAIWGFSTERPTARALRRDPRVPAARRLEGTPCLTDRGNIILDLCYLQAITHTRATRHRSQNQIAGVVENGLFISNMPGDAIVGRADGRRGTSGLRGSGLGTFWPVRLRRTNLHPPNSLLQSSSAKTEDPTPFLFLGRGSKGVDARPSPSMTNRPSSRFPPRGFYPHNRRGPLCQKARCARMIRSCGIGPTLTFTESDYQ